MTEDDTTLTDRWIKALKNHPIIATLLTVGFLITVASPYWTPIQNHLSSNSAGEEELQIDKQSLISDRDNTLVPVRNRLLENKAIFDRLNTPLYKEPGWGIQESYYERVRRDGPEMHELMGGMIDKLVANNNEILTLLDTYMGRVRTESFKEQEELFRKHAELYDARWTGMRLAAISGELQPIAEPVFPPDFPSSLDTEISRVQSMIDGEGGS